jgi:hypothetical protein
LTLTADLPECRPTDPTADRRFGLLTADRRLPTADCRPPTADRRLGLLTETDD